MKKYYLYLVIYICLIPVVLSIRYYIYHKDDPKTFFKTSYAAVFIYKNGIETDSYTSEIKVSQEHAGFLRIEEKDMVKVYFDMNGENK